MGSSLMGFRQSVSPLSAQDACAFNSFLSEGLERLEQSLAKSSISLCWSTEAMNLLKKIHIELLALFKKCKLPVSFEAEDGWFNQYLQETTHLLDFCNLLKSAISGINRYRMVINFTIQKFFDCDSKYMDINSLVEIEMKSNSFSEQIMSKKVELACSKKIDKSIAAVMVCARCTMIVLSVLLVSAIVSPLPIDIKSEELTSKFPELEPFVDLLSALVARFDEKVLNSNLVLVEHETVDRLIGDLRAQVMSEVVEEFETEKLMMSAKKLRTSSDELREGIEMFDDAVDQVFEVVMKGRNEMLAVFRDETLSGA